MKSIGIIGFGEFGQFITTLIPTNLRVKVFEQRDLKIQLPSNIEFSDFDSVAACEVVVLAVPLQSYEEVIQKLLPVLNTSTLVIDVCSVKTRSQALFDKYLKNHPERLCIHPLFGPQSAANGTDGKPVVVTLVEGARAQLVLDFCKHYLRLACHELTPEDHDKQMALVHALTFFTARGLLKMNVHEVGLQTPSFQKILDLASLEEHHSEELFQTIQKGNPYAAEVRQAFIDNLIALNKDL